MNLIGLQFLSILGLIVFSSIFSATEVAYTGLNINQLKRLGRIRPDGLALWEKAPDRVLAVLILSNNAVNIAIGVISATIAVELSRILEWKLSVATALTAFASGTLTLIAGEIIPKVWARQYTVSWALRVTPFMNVWCRIIFPLANAFTAVSNALLLNFSKKNVPSPFPRAAELKKILTHTTLPSSSSKILNNVIDFSASTVKQVMISRSEIYAVSAATPMKKIISEVARSGYSRVPVTSGSLDTPLGLLYTKDLLVSWRSSDELIILEDLLRPLHYVTPETPLPDLLRFFRSGRNHLALVQDGKKIVGLVTLQDALEAIAGDIKDEE